jgi:hypothetical protein
MSAHLPPNALRSTLMSRQLSASPAINVAEAPKATRRWTRSRCVSTDAALILGTPQLWLRRLVWVDRQDALALA